MTNNEVLNLIENVLFDLDTGNLENAKNTLKMLQTLLKSKNEYNDFKRMVYEKMKYYSTRDKNKNMYLYYFYQRLKSLPECEFDFVEQYQEYIKLIK